VRLDRVVGPDHRVFAQVRLAELVDVEAGGSSRAGWKALGHVVGKSVDSVICNRWTLDPVMAIEVDDRSHLALASRQRDAFVDKMFAEVGLPLMRVSAARLQRKRAPAKAPGGGLWLPP
jgi:hypothetical protein